MSDRSDQDADSQRATDESDGATDGPAEVTPRERDGDLRDPRDPDGEVGVAIDDSDGVLFGGDSDEELPERGPLEPGSPSLENAVFVLLGASGTVLLLLLTAI